MALIHKILKPFSYIIPFRMMLFIYSKIENRYKFIVKLHDDKTDTLMGTYIDNGQFIMHSELLTSEMRLNDLKTDLMKAEKHAKWLRERVNKDD